MERSLQDCNLLVVSDLHLSDGRNPRLGTFSPREDFFFDDQFARFLAYYRGRRDGQPDLPPWHLVIDGDFVDLLQVTTRRGAAPDMNRDRDRPYYGLASGARESAYKIGQVARGHEPFMRALAGWVVAGNAITVIKGNHDVELHYPAVRDALLAELRRAWVSGGGSPSALAPVDAGAIRFSDWFYYEKDLLWIEHGNQYEASNAFRYWLAPLLPEIPDCPPERKDEIDLPLGSFFVRYLFNRVENVEPFADNMKPAMRFVRWLLRAHPVVALRFLARDGSYMLGKLRRALRRLGGSAYAARERAHGERLTELSLESGIPREKLAEIDRLRAKTVLQEPAWWARALRPLLVPWISLGVLVLLLAIGTAAVLLAAARLLGGALPPEIAGTVPRGLADWVRTWGSWAVLLVAGVAAVLLVRWALAGEEKAKLRKLAVRASRIARLLPVRYVVMGHTHDPKLRKLGKAGGRALEYFNTGSWTGHFRDERDRLLGGDVRFVFLEAERRQDGLRPLLMEWDDGAGEPRLLELFHLG